MISRSHSVTELHEHEHEIGMLIVEREGMVKFKSVDKVDPAHSKPVLSYLRLTEMKLGYLLSLSEAQRKEGITRIVRGTC
jgi:GxxExxY protein